MHIKPNSDAKPVFGIIGHVGAGHVHSHKGLSPFEEGSLIHRRVSPNSSSRQVVEQRG